MPRPTQTMQISQREAQWAYRTPAPPPPSWAFPNPRLGCLLDRMGSFHSFFKVLSGMPGTLSPFLYYNLNSYLKRNYCFLYFLAGFLFLKLFILLFVRFQFIERGRRFSFFVKKILRFFSPMCMSILLACMSVHHGYAVSTEARRGS